jgi:hypothetical protein
VPIKQLQGQLQKHHCVDAINDYTLSSLLSVVLAAFSNLEGCAEVFGRLDFTQVEVKWLYVLTL